MATRKNLAPETLWIEIETGMEDWKAADPGKLVQWYCQMMLVRRFEEKLLELDKLGLIHGPAHASIGQEVGAVGAMSVLTASDSMNGTHRAHHQVLLKLITAVTPDGFDPLTDDFTDAMNDTVSRFMAEIMGLEPGYCGGRGGSMHMRFAEAGVMGTSAIVGGNPPHAAGYALADKILGRDTVSVAFFGDGATQNGASYEAINIAGAHKVPAIFFIENNMMGVSTRLEEVTRESRLSSRGAMLGVPSIRVDGMDVVAVNMAMQEARDIIRKDGGPVVVEAIVFRHFHQSSDKLGSDLGYRTKEEEAEWWAKDGVLCTEARLREMGLLDDAKFARINDMVSGSVLTASEHLTETKPGSNTMQIRESLWPDPATVDYGILGDLSELTDAQTLDHADLADMETEKVKLVAAASDVLVSAMQRDPTIILYGEDVHKMRGGVSGMTKGVIDTFPDRIMPMPIAENGFTGVAVGAALNGLRPVAEIMFGDFCFTAADQIAHGAGKVRHMFGGDFPVPMVLRVRVSPNTGYGSQHSCDPSALFDLFPGWRIFSPTNAFDYIGMMNAALRCNDPVAIIEHTGLYQKSHLVPKGNRDYCIPFGKAHITRAGEACTVLATSTMVEASVKAAKDTGIDAEVIDVRNTDMHGIDWDLIGASIAKTGRVMIAEETASSMALAGRWAGAIQERFFDDLDFEVLRATGSLSAPTVSKVLNAAAIASTETVAQVMQRLTETA
ncbi:alpha-ketoacid dehydrogenase subunit alpha/beta [Pacificoceanicola onchidii]|uniref:alpha-ketoacid dehydrogenase subunit alpha/beta n=1 Tax=Pacificoceanicola onchidii TaxID=2562685 RepID=UPI0010A69AD1|nr:alpha-ketoacid dehydrogenase subunit alpha/beta [Pacificoceanicola onchidii]